jgi:DNA-binding beta-propeller fold protein YncE
MRGSIVRLCLTAALSYAEQTPANSILVLEKAQTNLVIVDPDTRQVIARVPVGNDPHEVVASDDGKIAYVSNYERGSGTTIARVDLIAQKALPPIQLGPLGAPHGLAFAGGKLYFTAEAAKVVCRYDPATERIDWVMGTGRNRTHMVLVSKDLKTIFTSDDGSAIVSIIEPSTPPAQASGARGGAPSTTSITTIGVGPRSEGFDLSPDGKELWIANAQDASISVINLQQKKIDQTFPTAMTANRIKFSPDGKRVFVPDMKGTGLLVIDAQTRKEVARVELPGNAEGVVIAPDNKLAYVTLTTRDSIGVIDLKAMMLTDEIKTGKGPDGLAWAQRPQKE